MKLLVNNQAMQISNNGTLMMVVEQFGACGSFAVALNGQFVSRKHYATTTLTADDKIEILSPIAGG